MPTMCSPKSPEPHIVSPSLLATSPAQVWTSFLLVPHLRPHPLLLSFHFSDAINIHLAFRSMGHCLSIDAKNQ